MIKQVIMNKKKAYFKLFKDILTEDGDKYSQGRVYLLWSVFAYYITLIILTFAGINPSKGNEDRVIDIDNFRMIVEALEYAMTLFGGYVFGGKFISAYKAIKNTPKEEV